MLSCDTSEGNLASEQLSTGPVSEMIKAERFEYARQMMPFFKWILADAGVVVDWTQYELDVDFPELTAMDPLKASQIVTGAIMNETMSRATGRLRLNLDPDYEEQQIAKEKQSGLYNAGFNNQMGGADNQAASSKANATQGAGGNQGQSAVTGQSQP